MRNVSIPVRILFLQHGLVLIISLLVFFIQGPPYVSHLWDRLPEGGDSFINSWILSWNANAIFKPGISVWDAPIFFPVENALAFSEAMFGNLWITLPIQYLTDNPVFASNMLLLISFVLSAFCVYLLVFDQTRNFWASLIAGLVFSFNPYRWGHAGHLQLLPIFWSALAVLLANRFMVNPKKGYFFGMLIFVWIQYYASVYLGTMLLVFLVILFAANLIIERKGTERWIYLSDSRLRWLLLSGFLLSVLVLLPLGMPYISTAGNWNFYRSLMDNSAFSAEPLSFFFRPAGGFANYEWLHQVMQNSIKAGEGSVFLGTVPWMLLILGITAFVKKKKTYPVEQTNFVRRYLWIIPVVGMLMLGPYLILLNKNTQIPLIYQIVYYLIPGAKALRVPARFAQMFLLCMTIIGSFGVVVYLDISKRWPPLLKALPILLFCTVFLFDYSVRSTNGAKAEIKEEFPPVYRYLSRDTKNKRPVLELPVGRAGPSPTWNAFKYLHYQTAHWRPVLGGMSGWYPPGRLVLSDKLDESISSESFELINLTPAATLVVHLKDYSERDRALWEKADLSSFGFEFSGKFDDALVWERERNSPRLSDKLTALWARSTIEKGKLIMTAFFEPASNGHSWRYLKRGWSEIAVHVTSAGGKNRIYNAPIVVPPYILSGNYVRIELPKIKLHEQKIEKITITGPLIRDYTLVDNPDGHSSALITRGGSYVSAEKQGKLKLVGRTREIGENELFRIIELGENHVALKASNKLLVSAENGGDGMLVANRKIIDEWEIFTLEQLGKNQLALKTAAGKYVTAESGRLMAVGRTIDEAETFTITGVK
jgi:hypothetical protein